MPESNGATDVIQEISRFSDTLVQRLQAEELHSQVSALQRVRRALIAKADKMETHMERLRNSLRIRRDRTHGR